VAIMGSQKCRIVGKSQSVLIMSNPMISTRTRSHARRVRAEGGGDCSRQQACRAREVADGEAPLALHVNTPRSLRPQQRRSRRRRGHHRRRRPRPRPIDISMPRRVRYRCGRGRRRRRVRRRRRCGRGRLPRRPHGSPRHRRQLHRLLRGTLRAGRPGTPHHRPARAFSIPNFVIRTGVT
jgi:hypothetical protein